MPKSRSIFLTLIAVSTIFFLNAKDPVATDYTFLQCEGSLTPYPDREVLNEFPDSLTPVFINHVGRHGARYPAGPTHSKSLLALLAKADSLGTLTPLGSSLKKLTEEVIRQSEGQWGALDSLGKAEQRGIATRMFMTYPQLFKGGSVNAISSYSPRAMMSMFSFVHQLDRLSNNVEITTSTGRSNSPLMRFFDLDADYLSFRKNNEWAPPYNEYIRKTIPLAPIRRVVGNYPFSSDDEARDVALLEYYLLAGLNAMSMEPQASVYFSREEYNALWSCFNLRQYLQRTATTVSTIPANISNALLANLIATTDLFIAGKSTATVQLRFGHAETLMPLLSLMRIPGCYYMTNYFDTVGLHWKDFYVVPMAANLQIILFKSTSGRHYVRLMLNEEPVAFIPGDTSKIVEWQKAREYLMRCLETAN